MPVVPIALIASSRRFRLRESAQPVAAWFLAISRVGSACNAFTSKDTPGMHCVHRQGVNYTLSEEVANELKLIRAILILRDIANKDFTDFGADNVFEAIDQYLAPANYWPTNQIKLFEAMLATAEVDITSLEKIWGLLGEYLTDSVPEGIRPLIKEFRDYVNRNPGSISWPLQYKASFKFARSLAGKFDFEIKSNISLRAYASPPVPVRDLIPPDKAVLSAGILATAKANSAANWPFNLASISATGGGEHQVATQSYFKHEPGRMIGEALVEDIKGISVPFANGYIHNQFLATPSLIMVVYNVQGEAELGTSLGVVAPLAYGPLVCAELKIRAHYSLTSTFETRVSRLIDGNINIKLDSKESRTTGMGTALGVKLDLSQPLLPIHEALSGTLEEAKDLIDLLQTEWTFANQFEDSVKQHLGEISNQKIWLDFIERALNPAGETPFINAAKAKLSKRLNDKGKSWRSTAILVIDEVIDNAFDNLAVNECEEIVDILGPVDIKAVIKAKIKMAIDEISNRFLETATNKSEDLVNGVVKKANLAAFHPALENIESADKKLATIKQQTLVYFDRYLSYLRAIETTVRVLSENQLAAKISYYRSRSRGTSVLADITVTPHAARHYADQIDDLLAGRPDNVVALYDQGESGIQINQCLLGRFVESRKTLGFALTVLDFKLERQSILTSKVDIIEDQITGMVTVGTKAAIQKAQTLARDSRSIELISVAQLSSAKLTGVGGLSATFNRKEDKLEQDELIAFLQGFVDASIISEDQKKIALARAYESTGATLDIVEEAEVIAGVQWNDDHLIRLFSHERPITREHVFDAVIVAIDSLEVFDEDDFIRINNLRKNQPKIESASDMISFFSTKGGRRLRKRLGGRRHTGRPGSGTPGQSHKRMRDRKAADKGFSWAQNIIRLYDAIDIMRDIYHSSDDPWSRKKYKEQQDRLNKKLRDWIQLPGVISSLYAKLPWASDDDDRVKDHTLALIAVFIQLTGGEGTDTTLSVQLRLPAGKSKKNNHTGIACQK